MTPLSTAKVLANAKALHVTYDFFRLLLVTFTGSRCAKPGLNAETYHPTGVRLYA